MLHYLQGLLAALDLTSLMDAVLRVAAIFLCLTVHETCHGLAALALGDPTAKSMHRLSLNPLRHIDWLGLLMMFGAGFGWAKPVPVDLRYHWPGAVQFDPHSAPGRLQGPGGVSAGPAVHCADAL